jgi:hypothetical protein
MLHSYERHDLYSQIINQREWSRMTKVYETREADMFEVYRTNK